MSSWTKITFDPGDRTPEDIAVDLREAIENTDERICRESDQNDPSIGVDDNYAYWYVHGFEGVTALNTLDIACDRALAININDTSEAGIGYLYERVDNRFLQTDSFSDNEYGRRILDYFAIEHDLWGDRGV